jgi:hypothetical protein
MGAKDPCTDTRASRQRTFAQWRRKSSLMQLMATIIVDAHRGCQALSKGSAKVPALCNRTQSSIQIVNSSETEKKR